MSPASPDRRPLGFALSAAVVLLAGLLAMWPVLRSDFSVWDDPTTIAENPDLTPPTLAGLGDRWSRSHMHIYAPLTHTVWALVARLTYDANAARPLPPIGFKVASVVAHLLASVVVLSIARRAFGPRWAAVVAGVAFAAHPMQVEAVAWTSGLKDVLCGLFGALAIRFYLEDEGGVPRRPSLALVAMGLAMLAKPIAFTLPAVLLTIDALWLRRPIRESLLRLLPFALLSVACAAFARSVQEESTYLAAAPLWQRPLIAGFDFAFYLLKAAWPTRLAFDYGWSPRAIAASPWLWFAWLVPAAVAAVAWTVRRRLPFVGIGLAMALWPLVPVSGLVYFDFARVSVVADHYVYLPMVGGALAIGQVARVLARRWSGAAIGLTAVVLVVWAGLSMRQAATWRDAETVALRTLAINPRSAASLNHLGVLAVRHREFESGEDFERRSLEIEPFNPPALLTLGDAMLARKRYDEALEWYQKAADLVPQTREPWYAMSKVYELRGDELRRLETLEKGLAGDERLSRAERLQRVEAVRRAIEKERARTATTAPQTRTTAPQARP